MSQAKEFMRRWFDEVWNRRNEAAIDEMFAQHGRGHHFPETDAVIAGPAAFKEIYRSFCNAFPNLRVIVEDVIGEGNHVAVRWVATMTHTGDGLGIPPTGKNVSLPGSSFAVVEDGKMIEAWNYIDMGHLYKQLGASPA
jgi:steroid delta-isomerase-like uncharacterized protein